MYALSGNRLLFSTDKLFVYPLPNIYHRDNLICWGENQNKVEMKSLAAVEGLVKTFFESPFNKDLFDTGKLGNTFPWNKMKKREEGYDIEVYFDYLAKNDFQKEWLRPLGDGLPDDFITLVKRIGGG
jgi:hypothetical protein